MKYMILVYGSQQDYDSMAGKPADDRPAWSAEDFAALGAFLESFTKDLAAAAALASNLPQQRYLYARAARLAGD